MQNQKKKKKNHEPYTFDITHEAPKTSILILIFQSPDHCKMFGVVVFVLTLLVAGQAEGEFLNNGTQRFLMLSSSQTRIEYCHSSRLVIC